MSSSVDSISNSCRDSSSDKDDFLIPSQVSENLDKSISGIAKVIHSGFESKEKSDKKIEMYDKIGCLGEKPRGISNPIRNKELKEANFAVKSQLGEIFDYAAVQKSLHKVDESIQYSKICKKRSSSFEKALSE